MLNRMATAERSGRVLIVDDDRWLRDTTRELLDAEGHRVDAVGSAAAALSFLEQMAVEVVVLDLGLPDMDGLEVLRRLGQLDDRPAVIVFTGRDDIETIVEAMKCGAENFLVKPVDAPTLTLTVDKALHQHRLFRHAALYSEALAAQPPTGEWDLVGTSRSMSEVRELLARVAPTDSAVVLLGESGTGKGLAARLIHRLSRRTKGPFVDLSCAALPSNLVESEVFGHEQGAFTDAHLRKLGLLEVGNGGTVFLDEVAELELSVQGKLLKAIEDKAFRRVGGVRTVEVDVRFVVATHVDLRKAVESHRFRQDLYYRLNVFGIVMPPLRSRGDDVLELAFHFIRELNPRIGRHVGRIAEPACALLLAYPWPGNVRELRNVMERAMILATGDTIGPAQLPEDIRNPAGGSDLPTVLTLEETELLHVEKVVRLCKGNMKLAAGKLGISRAVLDSWLDRLGFDYSLARPSR